MPRNEKGSRETTRNVLDFPKMSLLSDWVKENYLPLGLDDVKTAEKAHEALGFTVSAGNIKYFRLHHGLEANYGRGARTDGALAARLEHLETIVKQQELFIAALKLHLKWK